MVKLIECRRIVNSVFILIIFSGILIHHVTNSASIDHNNNSNNNISTSQQQPSRHISRQYHQIDSNRPTSLDQQHSSFLFNRLAKRSNTGKHKSVAAAAASAATSHHQSSSNHPHDNILSQANNKNDNTQDNIYARFGKKINSCRIPEFLAENSYFYDPSNNQLKLKHVLLRYHQLDTQLKYKYGPTEFERLKRLYNKLPVSSKYDIIEELYNEITDLLVCMFAANKN